MVEPAASVARSAMPGNVALGGDLSAMHYYTNWSFVLFAVVMVAAYLRLSVAGVCSLLGARLPRALRWMPPPELVVGALANAVAVGIGGQLIVTYGKPPMPNGALVPFEQCARVARRHMYSHVTPMWIAAFSLLALPSVLLHERFSAALSALVPVTLGALWLVLPATRERLVLGRKIRRVYGRTVPLPAVVFGAPLVIFATIAACKWRSRV